MIRKEGRGEGKRGYYRKKEGRQSGGVKDDRAKHETKQEINKEINGKGKAKVAKMRHNKEYIKTRIRKDRTILSHFFK